MGLVRVRVLIALLSLLVGCDACHGDQCGYEIWGGGEFTITFSGAIELTITEEGLTQAEADTWVSEPFNTIDVDSRLLAHGITGGFYTEPLDGGGYTGFVAGVEPSGPILGCDGATFVRLYAPGDDFAQVRIDSGRRILLDAGLAQTRSFSGGTTGTATIDVGPVAIQCPDLAEGEITVDVSWRMDPSVHATARHECGAGDLGFY